jgi:tetratricopeptide (TPR) repeat protein
VTDNSLEQAISSLRRVLATPGDVPYIETQARRGYRFAAEVKRTERRETDEGLDALLAPHRAWLEGRAALESLERGQIVHARGVFARVLAQIPDQASAHVGMANACAMQFEMTRSDPAPDAAALDEALRHAREACRLDPAYGEAWATLGFVLDRTGRHADALAASRRAVSLEPDNWRHHVRLAYVGWGEERLRASARALALLPGFPLAHWLAATVHVARQAFDAAERELATGIASQDRAPTSHARFSGVALHWLLGLLRSARGDDAAALGHFERELALENSGHLYARECCANTWYAIGALRLRQGAREAAIAAFSQTLDRVPRHPLASAALAAIAAGVPGASAVSGKWLHNASASELAMARAAALVLRGDVREAAAQVERALDAAPEGSACWLLPVEPLLQIWQQPDAWSAPLARLRNRAA